MSMMEVNGLLKNTELGAKMTSIAELVYQHPRLRSWYEIGPVQRAELESFAEAVLSENNVAITADGVLVNSGDTVYVFSSTGKIQPTTVQPKEAVTSYYLFGQVPVAHSFSNQQAAENYQKYSA